jgi:hypothetical protein
MVVERKTGDGQWGHTAAALESERSAANTRQMFGAHRIMQ